MFYRLTIDVEDKNLLNKIMEMVEITAEQFDEYYELCFEEKDCPLVHANGE